MVAQTESYIASVDQARERIREQVRRLTSLARQQIAPQQFFPQFLERLLGAANAQAAAVWTLDERDQVQIAFQAPASPANAPLGQVRVDRAGRVRGVFQSGRGTAHREPVDRVTGRRRALAKAAGAVFVPINSEGKVVAVLEVVPRALPAASTGQYLRLLGLLSNLAGSWVNRHYTNTLRGRQSELRRSHAFVQAVYQTTGRSDTAAAIVNQGQQLVGCDRVTLAACKRGRWDVLSVSGQAELEHRSNAVRQLAKLSQHVAGQSEPLRFSNTDNTAAEPATNALRAYAASSSVRSLVAVPLNSRLDHQENSSQPAKQRAKPRLRRTASAVLIFENFRGAERLSISASTLFFITEHSTAALRKAQHDDRWPARLSRRISQSVNPAGDRTWPRRIAIATIVLIGLLVLALWPADFGMQARGVLQPSHRRDVFVDVEGVVVQTLVDHGDRVEQGDRLAILRNTQLEVDLANVLGRLQSTSERLAALVRSRHAKRQSTEDEDRLAGEQMQLEEQRASLERQHQLLLEKRERLVIRSPISGQVVTWNVQQQLAQRPVARGQVLMTIADGSGPWELEVHLPEKRVGHVVAALEQQQEIPIDFIVGTEPTAPKSGMLRSIDGAAQLHPQHGHSVRLLVDLDKSHLSQPRTGTTVSAKVYCGRRPLGYVWLHEVFEFFQSQFALVL